MGLSGIHSAFQKNKPIWFLRIGPMLCAVIVTLALTVFKEGPRHGFCLGLVLGILIGVVVTGFQIRSVEIADSREPSGTRLFIAK
jgi:predicted MFS family arabinose efflux permease